jgi:structural maintenance of chromosome 4
MVIFEKGHSKFKKTEYELKVKIEQDEDLIQESTRAITRHQASLNLLQLHHIDLSEPRPVLSVFEDADLQDFCRKIDVLDQQIRMLTERLQSITPNLRILEEYRQKEERLRVLEDELAQLDAGRQSCRENFEGLRQCRYEEFMAGFRTISTRLKEMYQLITLGGNAELELVDSLDPFSEGILFSVMPPKKSWKNICNLSGGEKTLSSLALVFALHTYKPTPIYVMDEIDAALDFRNVSIVAHYIKERTKNAQFIVISLRNDMFELADRLVGIYKTEQRTKSITIDPSNFALPQPAS